MRSQPLLKKKMKYYLANVAVAITETSRPISLQTCELTHCQIPTMGIVTFQNLEGIEKVISVSCFFLAAYSYLQQGLSVFLR